MRTAKWSTTAIEITCPYCNQPIEEPQSSSQYWTTEELEQEAAKNNGVFTCPECDKQIKLPTVKR